MTKQEMMDRMEELDKLRFFLSMKDRWNGEDYSTDRKWFAEWLDLKKKVEKM